MDGVGVRLHVFLAAERVVHLEHALREAHVVGKPRRDERRALYARGEENAVIVVAIRKKHWINFRLRALQ